MSLDLRLIPTFHSVPAHSCNHTKLNAIYICRIRNYRMGYASIDAGPKHSCCKITGLTKSKYKHYESRVILNCLNISKR